MQVLAPNENYALPPAGLARAMNLALNNTRGRGEALRSALAAALGVGVADVDLRLREPAVIVKAAVPLVSGTGETEGGGVIEPDGALSEQLNLGQYRNQKRAPWSMASELLMWI